MQDLILTKEGIYEPHSYSDEAELERLVEAHAQEVFGEDSIYFSIKQRLESKIGGRITDGLLLDFSKKPRFWVVEYERSAHDLEKHIQLQVTSFLRSLRREGTKREVQRTLYEAITRDPQLASRMKALAETEDIYYVLDEILHRKSGILVIIDEKTPELDDVVEVLESYGEVQVLTFKTFKRDDDLIHLFTPLASIREARPPEEEKEERPVHTRAWDARMRWATSKARSLALAMIQAVGQRFPDVTHGSKARWYQFWVGPKRTSRRLFLVLMLRKRGLKARIPVDPEQFTDPEGLTKRYKGWFFRRSAGEERGFSVESEEDIAQSMLFVEQAYKHTKRLLGGLPTSP